MRLKMSSLRLYQWMKMGLGTKAVSQSECLKIKQEEKKRVGAMYTSVGNQAEQKQKPMVHTRATNGPRQKKRTLGNFSLGPSSLFECFLSTYIFTTSRSFLFHNIFKYIYNHKLQFVSTSINTFYTTLLDSFF